MRILSKIMGFVTVSTFAVSTLDVIPFQVLPAAAAVPCRTTYSQDFRWRQLNRTGRVLINNRRPNPVQITLIHPDSASQFANWTVAGSRQTFLVYNNQPFYVGDDWGVQIGNGCIFYIGEVGIYNSQVFEITLTGSSQISLSGLESPSQESLPSRVLAPETSPQVSAEKYEDMGGGWGGARAVLNRDGSLFIEGQAVSNANNTATRTSVFVVGIDRRGRTLFVSNRYNLPTACGRWDPTCPSEIFETFTETISPDLAKYVSRLDVYLGQHGSTGLQASLDRFNQNIRAACASYDDLPVAARAAIAYETGFAGCNPEQ